MEDSGVEFPGFQTCSHRDELVFKRSMSRLQKIAPCPLQIKPTVMSSACLTEKALMEAASSSSSSSSSSTSIFSSKDPIPLLSPLAVLESTCIREENLANSH